MQNDYLTNRAYFHFNIETVKTPIISTQHFQSKNLALNRSYEFSITFLSEKAFQSEEILGKTAMLSIQSENDTIYYRGLITSIKSLPNKVNDYYAYEVTLSSFLYPLLQKQKSECYVNKTIIEIIEILLQDADFSPKNYIFNLSKSYEKESIILQYNENHLAFLNRLAHHYKIFYYFYQNSTHWHLVITDNFPTTLPSLTLEAKIKNNLKSGGKHILSSTIETHCRGTQLGQCIQVNESNHSPNMILYTIVKLNISGNQTNGLSLSKKFSPTYHATCWLAKNTAAISLPISNHPDFPSVLPAILSSTQKNSSYPDIDKHGRQPITFPFQISPSEFHPPSYARLAKLEYLFHFPLHASTECVVGFFPSIFQSPFILGAISGVTQPSPVNNENCMDYCLRTTQGNEITFTDNTKEQAIRLATKNHLNQLVFYNKSGSEQVTLHSKKEKITLSGKNDFENHVGMSKKYYCKNYVLDIKNSMKLKSLKSIFINSVSNSTTLKSENNYSLQSYKQNINVQSNQLLRSTSRAFQKFIVNKGNLSIQSEKNKITFSFGKQFSIKSPASCQITFSSPQSKITIKNNTIQMNAAEIILNAEKIMLFGLTHLNP